MAILNCPPVAYESLIATLSALEDDDSLFTLAHIKSRNLREGQWKEIQNKNTAGAALITSPGD